MRFFFSTAPTLTRAMIVPLAVAVLATVGLAAEPTYAQETPSQQVPMPPSGFKPLPPAPVKSYNTVAITPPESFNDPSFVDFRKNLADIAKRKDRAALAKLVVAQGFFWMQDKDLADKRQSGIDNLAKAINLDAKDETGWDTIAGYAEEPTASEVPDRKGVICAPADPTIDPQALETLGRTTGTDVSEWGYPIKDGTEVHATAQPNAPIVDKLGMYLVRVLPDIAPAANADMAVFLHVALPSGKTGYVTADSLVPLGGDQMCYIKDAEGWKIAGYFGGGAP